jgi:phage repressor protein C with HTH and peptisase S24 domain
MNSDSFMDTKDTFCIHISQENDTSRGVAFGMDASTICRMETWHERAKRRMKEVGKTQEDLIAPLGVTTRGAVGHYLNGRREPNAEQLQALAKELNCSINWLLSGAEEGYEPGKRKAIATIRRITTYNTVDELPEGMHVLIPRVAVDLSAGNGKTAWHVEERDPLPFLVDYIKRLGIKPQSAVVVKVSGDSMERTLFDDDSVIVNTAEAEVKDNGVYALIMDNDLMVKRLFKRPGGGLLVVSDNKDRYPSFEVQSDDLRHINIIGRVKYRSGSGDF